MKALADYVRLLLDVFSIKLFVWMLGKDGELLDSHLFLFDKYSDLADYHGSRGRIGKADRLSAIAELHFRLAPDDDPPEAAAMVMPVPPPLIQTDAVGTRVSRGSGRAQRFGPSASPTIEVGVLVRSKNAPPATSARGRARPERHGTNRCCRRCVFHADLRVGEADGPNR